MPCGAGQPGGADLALEDRPEGGEGLLLAPGFKGVGLGSLPFLFQFVNAVGQVAEAGQDRCSLAVGGAAGIFPQGHIAPVMRAVFNGRPMAANELQELGLIVLVA